VDTILVSLMASFMATSMSFLVLSQGKEKLMRKRAVGVVTGTTCMKVTMRTTVLLHTPMVFPGRVVTNLRMGHHAKTGRHQKQGATEWNGLLYASNECEFQDSDESTGFGSEESSEEGSDDSYVESAAEKPDEVSEPTSNMVSKPGSDRQVEDEGTVGSLLEATDGRVKGSCGTFEVASMRSVWARSHSSSPSPVVSWPPCQGTAVLWP